MDWYEVENTSELVSPNLLVYPDRIRSNILKMIDEAGGAGRLRPHIKTHKMAEIIKIQQNLGIQKFKCATIAEAELLALNKAEDILLAMQPVAIDQDRFFDLIKSFPDSKFSTLVDNSDTLLELAAKAKIRSGSVDLWLDINNGMNRSGINPGIEAIHLYKSMRDEKHVTPRGFHVYDGQIHDSDLGQREKNCLESFSPVMDMKDKLESSGYQVVDMVVGGTPSFPVFSNNTPYELSPGTPVLWDAGYQSAFPDMIYKPAAVLLTRIVSKPSKDLLCLDLGHKSVASEMPLPRVEFLGDHQFEQVCQSEEHLVVRCRESKNYKIGQPFYALPIHVCPTVAKYPFVLSIEKHALNQKWSVAARDQNLTKT